MFFAEGKINGEEKEDNIGKRKIYFSQRRRKTEKS